MSGNRYSVLGKQCILVRVCVFFVEPSSLRYLASSVPMDGSRTWRAVFRSGSEPLSPKLARWDNPKPLRSHKCELRVFRRFIQLQKSIFAVFRYSSFLIYRSLSLTPSAVFQSTLPLDVCPKITADAADGALNS